MRVAVWILLLCAAAVVLSKPTHKSKMALKREMKGLLRKLRQNTDNCRELSESFGAMARHSATLQTAVYGSSALTEENTETLIDMAYGFDIVNDDAAREQYTCAITQSQSLSQLKESLEDNDLLHNLFRFAYDYAMFGLPLGKQSMTGPSQVNELNMVNALESAGLSNLDPDRVQMLADMFVGPYYNVMIAGYVPAAPYPGNNNAKCSHVNNAFRALVQEMLAAPDAAESVAIIQQITGLDVTDNDAMRNLFCDLVDGAENGVQGLYDALNRHGVFSSMFKAGYPYVQMYVPIGRQMMEQTLAYLTNTIPPVTTSTGYPDYPQPPGSVYYNQYFQSPTKRNHDDKAKRTHVSKTKRTRSVDEKSAKSLKDKRHYDQKDTRHYDHKDKRHYDHKDKRQYDHKDKRHYDHKDKRGNGGQLAYGGGQNELPSHYYYGGGPSNYGYGGPGYVYPGYGGSGYGGPGYGGPGYGGPGYGGPGYGGPGYGGPGYGGPGYGGPDYGGPDYGSEGPAVSHEELIESTRLAIDFMEKLEASNLLTLPNDL